MNDAMAPRPRVLVTLMGDIDKDAARIKYGFLVKALERQLPVVAVHDTTLKGVERLLNALWVFHPNREIWRQRFYKNPAAFRARSRGAAALVRRFRGKADVVFQINTMFAYSDESDHRIQGKMTAQSSESDRRLPVVVRESSGGWFSGSGF